MLEYNALEQNRSLLSKRNSEINAWKWDRNFFLDSADFSITIPSYYSMELPEEAFVLNGVIGKDSCKMESFEYYKKSISSLSSKYISLNPGFYSLKKQERYLFPAEKIRQIISENETEVSLNSLPNTSFPMEVATYQRVGDIIVLKESWKNWQLDIEMPSGKKNFKYNSAQNEIVLNEGYSTLYDKVEIPIEEETVIINFEGTPKECYVVYNGLPEFPILSNSVTVLQEDEVTEIQVGHLKIDYINGVIYIVAGEYPSLDKVLVTYKSSPSVTFVPKSAVFKKSYLPFEDSESNNYFITFKSLTNVG